MEQSSPWYVLTGGPCAGKTTTIDALERRGYPVVFEPARKYFEDRLAAGKTIDEIRTGNWLQEIAQLAVAAHDALPRDKQYFFDRGVPDSVAYYRSFNVPVDDVLRDGMARVRYGKVFLLDLIELENDAMRNETPEQAMILHGMIRESYVDQGYEIVEVPMKPVEERVDFILERL